MSKQTINIGASPNDGTGTPLRTSFDYCNQNFTELYTATGPSGNNIVVPGNATITGDLTVDTSTLKVDSTNNRVGIGTATPNNTLTINGTAATWTKGAYIIYSDAGSTYIGGLGNGGNIFGSGTDNDIGITTGGATNLRLGTNNTERMRIDSSGNVGVGVVPKTTSGVYRTIQNNNAVMMGAASDPGAYWNANCVYNTIWRYIINGRSSRYEQGPGTHAWFYDSGTQTADANCSFVQAMTLDASGRLIRGGSTADTLGTDVATMVNIGNFAVQNAAAAGTYIAIKPDVANQNVNINIDARTGAVPDLRFLFSTVEKFRMTAGGNLNVQNGNVVMTTSGKGIDFSAVTGGTGTATANVLNDYEEGTFTPTVGGSTTAGVGVYTTQTGRYTKVGRLVTVEIYIGWSAHTGTGNLRILGLPFTVNATNYSAATIGIINNIALSASNTAYAFNEINSTFINIVQSPVGGGSFTDVPMDVAGLFVISSTYSV